MQSDTWYDLVLRELSGSDAGEALRKDAETAQASSPAAVPEDEAGGAPPA